MESSTETNTTNTNCNSSNNNSPSSSNNSSPRSSQIAISPPIVVSPCAACKILRRRCADKCVLAPYFPPTDPAKFTIAHRVFGASNIIKFLQELPESQRADAVSSMVYEASARIRDPVYGCAGAICHLQKQVAELQAQLAKAQAEVANMQCQQANLVALICMEMAHTSTTTTTTNNINNANYCYDSSTTLLHQQQALALDGSSFINNNIITSPTTPIINNNTFLEDSNNLGQLWELWT